MLIFIFVTPGVPVDGPSPAQPGPRRSARHPAAPAVHGPRPAPQPRQPLRSLGSLRHQQPVRRDLRQRAGPDEDTQFQD